MPAVVWAQSEFMVLKQRLIADGFPAAQIQTVFAGKTVQFDPKGVALFFQHNESKLNYDQFLSAKSIQQARQYMRNHQQALEQAQKNFGVQPTIITAILLVETRLGTYLGARPIFNSLATMAALKDKQTQNLLWNQIPESRRLSRAKFDAKAKQKSKWAYAEIKALLNYAKREQINPTTITGSYAGAMGISQFMPSNALKLAVDGNQDGQVDLFTHEDAIASIANYLKQHGWQPDLSRKQAYRVLLKYNYSRPYAETLLKIADKLSTT